MSEPKIHCTMSSFPAIRQFTIIMLMFVFGLSATAQENDITTWRVEERCIPDPRVMPNDWSYSGTIMMSGYAGIHGVRMDWETPHVVAFFREDSESNYPLAGGQLSPNGQWYAMPLGISWVEPSFNNYWAVRGIRIYSMSDESQVLEFDMTNYQDIYRYIETAWSYLPIEWINNEALIMGQILLYPFDNRAETASFNTLGSVLDDRFFSPDATYTYGWIRLNDVSYKGLYQISEPQESLQDIGDIDGMSWRRDSSGFIANLHDEAQDWNGLVYYERDGTLVDYIFNAGDRRITFERDASGRNELRWSPDNGYFAYIDDSYTEPSRLYILDFEQKIVIDTCLSPLTHPVWSPDGNMLAYVALARENLKVVVVDLQRWQAFDVARHSGRTRVQMVGWRADD
jgi:hypothetical protein